MSIKQILLSQKGSKWITIIGIVGILLVFVSSLNFGDNNTLKNKTDKTTLTNEQYIDLIENKLSYMISSIDGAGRTNVLVTLQNGIEYVYAQEEKLSQTVEQNETVTQQNDDSEKNYIIVDSGNGKSPIILTQLEPKIKGVVVVCQGGDNAVVKQNIISAIKASLNISSSCICVSKLVS